MTHPDVTGHLHLPVGPGRPGPELLDALADRLALGLAPPACVECRTALDALEVASAEVATQLATLAAREAADPLLAPPPDFLARLDDRLQAELLGPDAAEPVDAEPVDVIPLTGRAGRAARDTSGPTRRQPGPVGRALLAVAAAGALVTGVVVALPALRGDDAQTARELAAGPVRLDTGTPYSATSLPGTLTALLRGTPPGEGGDAPAARTTAEGDAGAPVAVPQVAAPLLPATDGPDGGGTTSDTGSLGVGAATDGETAQGGAADPLARLRTDAGLASCLTALSTDSDALPLLLDYGTFDGVPALVVALPVAGRQDKADVFVVGAGCTAQEEDLLHFARVDR